MVQFSVRLEKEDCKDLEEYARSKRLPRAVCARMLIQERLSELKEETKAFDPLKKYVENQGKGEKCS